MALKKIYIYILYILYIYKLRDTHQYLDYTSSHPEYTKKSIVYSQTLRLQQICSFEIDFLKRKNEMKSWFPKRGCPERLIEKEMKKVKFNHSHFIGKHSKKGIPLVVTYHPLLKSLSKIISKNYLHLLYKDEEVKRVFTPGPMISFRSPKKVSSYLLRAKLYPTERVVGSFKCSKPRCLVCVNFTETNTFSSTVTSKTYKINHKFDCDQNCLVYLLTCKHCGIQYVGQTVADYCYQWNNYKDNCRKHSCNENCMQKHLYDHYLSCNNDFLNMVSVTFIDKTGPSNPLQREQYWRHILQTNALHGLNIADGV